MSDDPILSALSRLQAGQEAIQAGQEAIRDNIKDMRAGFLAELGARTGAIMEKVAELRGDVTAIRDDIAVNMGAVDQVERINENTRGDVRQIREQMSVMWKQLKAAQEDIRILKGHYD